MANQDVICFFHANCTDGAAAAAVVKKKYAKARLYPLNHGDPVKVSVKDRVIFIVDFSFDANLLAKFKEKAKEVYWYDHHKTALPAHQKLGWGVLDLTESGASLTWKQEFPNQPMPKILEYVRDKDLYEWKLPDSREISMYLRGVEGITNPNSKVWKEYLAGIDDSKWQQMIQDGAKALKFQRQTLQQGLKSAFVVDFHGHPTLAVNWNLEASDMGEVIYKDLGYDVALMFYYTGKEWNFSLRSDRLDVSELAVKYGGGGHPGAAGFRQPNLDFLLKMKRKKKPSPSIKI